MLTFMCTNVCSFPVRSITSMHVSLFRLRYPVFLTILLAHRTFRDDEKCQQKYGDAWTDYCKHVPFKMVPGIF